MARVPGWTPGRAGVGVLVAVGLPLAGCSSMQQPEVAEAATTFEDADVDPRARCGLLAPATLAALEKDASASCAEAIEQISLGGGAVESVQIWGGDAQVRLSGDTLFLTETRAGWRVTAAACSSRGEAPYACEVAGP